MAALRKYGVLAMGALLLAAGAIVLVAAQQASFGWTAYAPLNSTTFVVPSGVGQSYAGIALMAVGLLLAAGWVGFRIGRRRA